EFGFDRCTRRRVAGRNPGVPYGIHFGEIRHVGDPDIGRNKLALVGTGLCEQAVDLPEDIFGLVAGVFAPRRVRDTASEIDGIAVQYSVAHARPDIVTFDTHAFAPSEFEPVS